MVFKAMRLDAITKAEYVELGLSPRGSKTRLGRVGETSLGSEEILGR